MNEFNGYVVRYLSKDTDEDAIDRFFTEESILDRGFREDYPDQIPTAEEFADGLYEVFGIVVHSVRDADGVLLYRDQYSDRKEPDELVRNLWLEVEGAAGPDDLNTVEEKAAYKKALLDVVKLFQEQYRQDPTQKSD